MSAKSSTKSSAAKTSSELANLCQWNKYLALLYAAQGLVILVLSVARTYPVTMNFLGVDTLQTQAQGHTVLAAGTHHLFDISLVWVVAAFLFAAAIAHGLAATKLRGVYEKDLRKGVNKVRWIEHAFSAGVMLVAIGLLAGISDLSGLLMVFVLSAFANLVWFTTELLSKVNWLGYAVGCIAGVVPWVVLAIYLLGAHLYGSVPAFVYWAAGTTFILFAALAVNLYLQHRKIGNWTNYLYGERMFMVLSLAAKTALAWQIFAGVLHP